jgi:hypothetical protein
MNKEVTLGDVAKKVEVLLKQYDEYQKLSAKLTDTNNEEQAARYKRERDAIADAMFFDDPLVWLMYKHKAYKQSDQAINTIGDLRAHVAPHDDICHKRYIFLINELRKIDFDFANNIAYPDSLNLAGVYEDARFIHAIFTGELIEKWKLHEYWKDGDKVVKWRNYSS